MASQQSIGDMPKYTAAQKVEGTKDVGAGKAGQAQDMGQASKEKTSELYLTAQQKMDEAKKAASETTQSTMEKAAQAKDSAASMLEQNGSRMGSLREPSDVGMRHSAQKVLY
ncbi:hypothetical protein R1sor_014358 [Riccia sorocarpa]|uniref:Uncharacterized protein n=1 Tax=Riccia sorocarpa TaxID=122646 RepID=A0ABD3HC12_9MARC